MRYALGRAGHDPSFGHGIRLLIGPCQPECTIWPHCRPRRRPRHRPRWLRHIVSPVSHDPSFDHVVRLLVGSRMCHLASLSDSATMHRPEHAIWPQRRPHRRPRWPQHVLGLICHNPQFWPLRQLRTSTIIWPRRRPCWQRCVLGLVSHDVSSGHVVCLIFVRAGLDPPFG
jgi:hypothetical protein